MKDLAFLKITVQRYGMMGRMKREKGVESEIEVEIENEVHPVMPHDVRYLFLNMRFFITFRSVLKSKI